MAFEKGVGGAEFVEDFVVGHGHCGPAIGGADQPFNTRRRRRRNLPLRERDAHAYRGRQIGGARLRLQSLKLQPG